jgi:hypothetical protein
MAVTVGE